MKRRICSALRGFEQLESRDAPATLVNATTVPFQDVDGDDVTVKITKQLFWAATINNVFDFSVGSVNGNNATKQKCWGIDRSGLSAQGATLKLTATPSTQHGGDGFANLGYL